MSRYFKYIPLQAHGITMVRINMNGARARPMVTDDFGNLVDLDLYSLTATVSN